MKSRPIFWDRHYEKDDGTDVFLCMYGWAEGEFDADFNFVQTHVCNQVVYKNMLCKMHFKQVGKDYIPTEYMDDATEIGQDRLDGMIRWIFEYDADLLDQVLGEKYGIKIYPTPEAERKHRPWMKFLGYGGYQSVMKDWHGCVECNGPEIHGRGLCNACYADHTARGTIVNFPTRDYIKRPMAYIKFVTEHHLFRLMSVGHHDFDVTLN